MARAKDTASFLETQSCLRLLQPKATERTSQGAAVVMKQVPGPKLQIVYVGRGTVDRNLPTPPPGTSWTLEHVRDST